MPHPPHIQAGFDFESDWEREMDARKTAGSGSTWHTKLDNHGAMIIWSLKATKQQYYTITLVEFSEASRAVEAPGGVGGDIMPAQALRLDSLGEAEDFVVLRKADFKSLVSRRRELITESKRDAKERIAQTSQLDRGDFDPK